MVDLPIISREEARAAGLKRYFTGILCVNGHLSDRNVSQGSCMECSRATTARARARSPDKDKLKQQEYYRRNRAARIAKSGEWIARNADAYRAKNKKWWADNHDKMLIYARNRRARIRSSSGTHTPEDIAIIAKAQGHRCAYCRVSLRKNVPQVDHIHPLVKGGSNGKHNLQLTCKSCNSSKRAKDPIEFAQARGMLL